MGLYGATNKDLRTANENASQTIRRLRHELDAAEQRMVSERKAAADLLAKAERRVADLSAENVTLEQQADEHRLTDEEFRALLNLWMCCDIEPWNALFEPLVDRVQREARKRGYDCVPVAYHEFGQEVDRD